MMHYFVLLFLWLVLLTPAAAAAPPDIPVSLPPGEISVTRADLIQALWEGAGAVPYAADDTFLDVNIDDPWATAVGWAKHEGLILGTGSGNFAPERPLTREEAAVILRRWGGAPGAGYLPPRRSGRVQRLHRPLPLGG